ncbi:MAG: hypothetical protein K0S38_1062, partial [Candidatus Paceibacter sp.]|nr:hypothetical protein [Candidatus Paceibacter sp.]
LIIFSNQHQRRVKAMRRYASFAEMVSNEDSNRIMPEYSPERIISGLRQIYPPDKERLGVLVFELEVVA